MNKKIALCFLTYDNLSQPVLWKNFLNSNFNVYIHNKYYFNSYFSKFIIKNKIQTEWGHISLVKASLILFKEAFENEDNEFFVLLSDKCIPLYSAEKIYEIITEINNNIISHHSQLFSNIPRYDKLLNKNFFKKNDFLKQSQWMVLKRDTVKFLINNDYTNHFGNDFYAPDEHYFINILKKFNIDYVNKRFIYINWNDRSDDLKYKPTPKTYSRLTNEIIENILNSEHNYLFMRKVSPECILPSYFDKIIYKNTLKNNNYLIQNNNTNIDYFSNIKLLTNICLSILTLFVFYKFINYNSFLSLSKSSFNFSYFILFC